MCNGNNSCVGCDGVPNSGAFVGCDGVCSVNGKVNDRCGVCGGTEFADPPQCTIVDPDNCVEVDAPPQLTAFRRRFIRSANLLYKRLQAEVERAQRYQCSIEYAGALRLGREELNFLIEESRKIFHSGTIRVCNNTCVTVAYAEHIKALRPTFRRLSERALSIAKQVAACIQAKGIPRPSKRPSSSAIQTTNEVREEINRLVEECRKLGTICKKRSGR